MTELTILDQKQEKVEFPKWAFESHRALTDKEIQILEKNRNLSQYTDWSNVLVSKEDDCFCPELIQDSRFEGFVVLGKIKKARIKFHDLSLDVGIFSSLIRNSVIGDFCSIVNVKYLENYHLGNNIILFNVQEMSCTNHSRFGNGIIFEDEGDSYRTWIGIANENDGRAVLPFEGMIPADAYIWSQNRDDTELQQRFIELTDYGVNKKKNTFGIVEDSVVIKNSSIIKDAKICTNSYIKGAFKIKNVTILSSEKEETQIGEGVELVNGIVGYGSRIFYQAIAVRFVIGRNCQLKYGARLLNSVLGDNSTVSCCELLNNLIFPFHEQHHNSSFLISTIVMGQSNIAANATIGSNHNSRSPDGEIIAGRGFWPGLCTNFKHNSKFASFVLASKGNYNYELNVNYPFCLISPGEKMGDPIHVLPAWWFMYDMFAIVRNKYKFVGRDKRALKVQNIEMSPFAPDTMQEVLSALDRIIILTANNLESIDAECASCADTPEKSYQAAKDYLHQHPLAKFTLTDMKCQKKFGATIYKPVQAYKAYRKILKYFATQCLYDYCVKNGRERLNSETVKNICSFELYKEWKNAGGQVIPEAKLNNLYSLIKEKKINCWDEVHAFYNKCWDEYLNDKARYAIYILEWLYSRDFKDFTSDIFEDIIQDVTVVTTEMYDSSVSCREKDYTDFFRCMTYKDKNEMNAVLGSLKDNSFLKQLNEDSRDFANSFKTLFADL